MQASLSHPKSVAFVQASLSNTQVFVFYFINNLCSVELVNKNINCFFTPIFKEYECRFKYTYTITYVEPGPAHRARAPLFEIIFGFVLIIFNCKTRIIIVNMQCAQYVFYSLT